MNALGPAPVRDRLANAAAVIPGLLVCLLFGGAAEALGALESSALGRAWIEPLVLAILLGALTRNLVGSLPWLEPGIRFSGKTLLDVAVALLGAGLSVSALESLGLLPFLLIAAMVVLVILLVQAAGRLLGLGRRLALLIAVGNAICGNSAIAAVAPVIGATEEEIAASISLTALNGVLVVLLLPVAVYLFGMSLRSYALLSGLTVYAVPQVIAATAAFGTATVSLATLVKLARVLMLGPVTLTLSLLEGRRRAGEADPAVRRRVAPLPWFVVAFIGLALLRWSGVMSTGVADACTHLSNLLAVIAMAALGFAVRLANLLKVGPRVIATTGVATLCTILLALLLLRLI